MLEIERKFLPCGEWRNQIKKSYQIAQGYMCADAIRTVRVRIRDDKAFLTIKGRSSDNGFSRYEWEKEIPLNEGRELFTLCQPEKIEKIRHEVIFGGKKFEIDEFLEDNKGLVIIEIELNSENEQFEKPDWLGMEVTGDPRYYNSYLTRNPYKDWQKK